MIHYLIISILSIGLVGCSSFSTQQDEKFSLSQVEVAKEDRELIDLKEIQSELIAENNAHAEKLIIEFNKRYPNTRYQISYDFLKVWLLELNGQWKKAIEEYRAILTSNTSPKVRAEASYRLGWCYMNISENEKALASYLDAYSRRELLLPEVGLAEIPAKIGSLYMKMADRSLAQDYLKKAEEGLEIVKKIKVNSSDKSWLAYNLYQMGHIYQSQVQLENFSDEVLSFKSAQLYLIRSIELNQAPWSNQALEYFENIYNQFYQFALKAQQSEKKGLIREILPMIYEAQTRRPYGEEVSNDLQKQLFVYLDLLDQRLSTELTANPVYIRLTKEAEELENVKKNAELVDPATVIPNVEPQSLDNPVQDPNL